MQFSENWLRSLINPALDSEALAHTLTMAGLEVEERAPLAPPFSDIVVARITALAPHPNADRLRICTVDAGDSEALSIVCGAPNAAGGMLVPLARVGARLPDGNEIRAASLRGVASAGMLCSARELGLSQDHDGLMVLPANLTPGDDLRQALALDDWLLTVKMTPNRADCLSLLGIARELASLTAAPLNAPPTCAAAVDSEAARAVVLDAPAACPRFCSRVITLANPAAATPAWMRQRLERSGIRPLGAVVDITNYVMLELGQPLHAYDNSTLSGAIHVRPGRAGERLQLLNEQEVELDTDTLLIADEKQPLGLAGMMGGAASAVTLDSSEILLEAAFFAPDAIAGRAQRYNLNTDASHRFERGVDFTLPERAIERASALIGEICGARFGPLTEAVSNAHLPLREAITLRPARVRQQLGIALDDERILALLKSAHLAVTTAADGSHQVCAPPFRFDIAAEPDLVEEVARLHGYDNIPVRAPLARMQIPPRSDVRRPLYAVKQQLAARDFQEVINYAFIDAGWLADYCTTTDAIRLANPIASQMSVMRPSLIPGLFHSLLANVRRQQERVRLFESGRCFLPATSGGEVEGFAQPHRLALIATGNAHALHWEKPRSVDFYDLKGEIESLLAGHEPEFKKLSDHPALHPGRAASIWLGGKPIGVLGEIHPIHLQNNDLREVVVACELSLDSVLASRTVQFAAFSRQPLIRRDVAFIAPQALDAAALYTELRKSASKEVINIEIFDLYQGEGLPAGQKSLAFRVTMQDTQRSLEDAEADSILKTMIEHAQTTLDVRLRT